MGKKEPKGSFLVLIGILKLFKAALLFTVGVGAFRLLHHDTRDAIETWSRHFRVDPENIHIHRLLSHIPNLSDRTLRELGVGTFIYAALFTVEGTGLVLWKRWAEYVTVVSTSLFLPLEVYEVIGHFSIIHPPITRIVALAINAAVVVYLVYRIKALPPEVAEVAPALPGVEVPLVPAPPPHAAIGAPGTTAPTPAAKNA